MELFYTHISEESKRLVQETLDSGRLSEGERVKEFEKGLNKFGLWNPVTVNSGTSALHLALVLSGVERGDEVILPPQTFVATGMAILYCGATPIFADIDPFTGNLCPESVQKKLTPKTKAVIPVHWTGLPCYMEDINYAIERESELFNERPSIIEDAAHALGAVYQQDLIGKTHWSRFCCFSFQSTKLLTTGDGGCICSSIDITWDKEDAIHRRWFGIPRGAEIGPLGERDFSLQEVGYKYHLNDLAASLGIGNLHTLPQRLTRRQQIAKQYREELDTVKDIEFIEVPGSWSHAYYAFAMKVNWRDDFVQKMKEKGIPCSIICSRIDKNPVFGGIREDLVGQREFSKKSICLPCHENLSDEDVQQVIDAVRGGW